MQRTKIQKKARKRDSDFKVRLYVKNEIEKWRNKKTSAALAKAALDLDAYMDQVLLDAAIISSKK